jgi:hypothetical protein
MKVENDLNKEFCSSADGAVSDITNTSDTWSTPTEPGKMEVPIVDSSPC